MDAPQKFRKALNGFHRDDVVRYIEFLNAKHQSQVNQLNMEIENLRSQAATREEAKPDQELLRQVEMLEEKLAQSQAQQDAMKAEREESLAQQEKLRAELEERQALGDAMKAELGALREKLEACESQREQLQAACQVEKAPLETYRHAQSMEQESRNRAELVYYQANGVLSQASAKVEGAAQEITALADQATEALTRLQMAVSGSKHTLQDASAMMKSIRPNG